MKQVFGFFILFNLTIQILQAQHTSKKKSIFFKTRVIDFQNVSHKGYIATLDDSTLFITPKKIAITFEKVNLNGFSKFNYSEIRKVNLHRTGRIVRGMILGGKIGLSAGLILGFSHPAQSVLSNAQVVNGFLLAFLGGGVGCLSGAAIGALSNKVFHINGRQDKLNEMEDKIISQLE
jgi:hypothetical protein